MSEDPIMEDGKVTDADPERKPKTDKEVLRTPLFYGEDEQTRIELTLWGNTYKDDDEQQQALTSGNVKQDGTAKDVVAFPTKAFKPYFREALQKFIEEQGGQ